MSDTVHGSTELRVVIADDEPLVRRGLRRLLSEEPGVRVVAEARDGIEATEAIACHHPDVLFLDVQMPERDGFGVLNALRDHPTPAVVFVTAYDRYAVRAFDAHAVDYLLKPFDDERFHLAMARLRARLAEPSPRDDARLEGTVRSMLIELRARREQTPAPHVDRVLVKHAGRTIVLAVNDIDWIEAEDNYVRLHTARRAYLIREPLSALEARLDPSCFARIHRSAIVNRSRVHALEPQASGGIAAVLSTGVRLPVGRRYRRSFEASMGATK
jgi:two-component system LytT family response regulator